MTPTPCPPRTRLRAFSSGQLPAADLDAIGQHVLGCAACQQALETLAPSSDSVVAGLKRADRADPFVRETQCQQAVAQIQAITPAAFSAAPLPAQLGRYQLLEPIGRGGMGAVFKALHPFLKREVALKVLPPERLRDTQAVARFRREMEAVGKLQHPNIVQATDAGESDGQHFLVMEYVAGCDLARLVHERGPLGVADSCELVRQAALGLRHAHAHGLVHRDIKPSNLMLTAAGQVKVLDLGLALLRGAAPAAELTASGQVMGTLDYMAPEQAFDAHRVDGRADVYSLGCTLYFLLTGRPPYAGEKYRAPLQKMLAHAHEAVPALGQPDIPKRLEAIVQRMLAKKSADRFAGPAEVAEALAPLAAGADLARLHQPAERPSTSRPRDDTVDAVSAPMVSTHTTQRRPITLAATPSRRRWILAALVLPPAVLLLLLGFGAWYFGATLLRIVTNQGELVLKCDSDDVEVIITQGGKQVTILDRRTKERIDLPAGDYEAALTRGPKGYTLQARQYTITRAGRTLVEVRFEPTVAAPPATPKEAVKPPREVMKPPTTVVARQPNARVPQLPGLVPEPARVPGVERWQLETRWPHGEVIAFAWKPASRILACRARGSIRLYDVSSGRLLRLFPHEGAGNLAWSPDGAYLASAGDASARVWHVAEGTLVQEIPQKENVLAVAWSTDGRHLAFGSGDRICIWDVGAGKAETYLDGHARQPRVLAWQPGAFRLASGGGLADRTVKLWDPRRPLPLKVLPQAGAVRVLAWSPDGRWLASGCSGSANARGGVHLWTAAGEPAPVHAFGSLDFPRSLSWLPDSRRLTVVGWGGDGGRTWDIATGKSLGPAHGARWTWSPDGELVATASENLNLAEPAIRVAVAAGDKVVFASGRFTGRGAKVAWSADGKHIVSGTTEGWSAVLQVWDADARRGGPRSVTRDGAVLSGLAFNPKKPELAFSSLLAGAWRWDLNTRDTMGRDLVGDRKSILDLSWAPDGERLALVHEDGSVRFWSSTDTLGRVFLGGNPAAQCVAWSPTGSWVAVGGVDGVIRLRHPDDKGLPKELKGHQGPVRILAWSADGKWLASASPKNPDGDGQKSDSTLRIWNVTRGTQERNVPLPVFPSIGGCLLAWSPDGRVLALTPEPGTIQFVSTGDWKLLRSVKARTDSAVRGFAWGPKSDRFATTEDGVMTVWDAASGKALWIGIAHGERATCALSGTGEVLRWEAGVDEHLVYVVETPGGVLEVLAPAEFRARTGQKIKAM